MKPELQIALLLVILLYQNMYLPVGGQHVETGKNDGVTTRPEGNDLLQMLRELGPDAVLGAEPEEKPVQIDLPSDFGTVAPPNDPHANPGSAITKRPEGKELLDLIEKHGADAVLGAKPEEKPVDPGLPSAFGTVSPHRDPHAKANQVKGVNNGIVTKAPDISSTRITKKPELIKEHGADAVSGAKPEQKSDAVLGAKPEQKPVENQKEKNDGITTKSPDKGKSVGVALRAANLPKNQDKEKDDGVTTKSPDKGKSVDAALPAANLPKNQAKEKDDGITTKSPDKGKSVDAALPTANLPKNQDKEKDVGITTKSPDKGKSVDAALPAANLPKNQAKEKGDGITTKSPDKEKSVDAALPAASLPKNQDKEKADGITTKSPDKSATSAPISDRKESTKPVTNANRSLAPSSGKQQNRGKHCIPKKPKKNV